MVLPSSAMVDQRGSYVLCRWSFERQHTPLYCYVTKFGGVTRSPATVLLEQTFLAAGTSKRHTRLFRGQKSLKFVLLELLN